MVTELMQTYPVYSIIVFSLIVTLISTLLTKWLTNQEHLRNLKKRQKEIQGEIKQCTAKGDDCRAKELQSEMLSITGVMMKSSFKPVLITFIPFLILIYWLRGIYTPLMGSLWIWWYIGASIVSSIIYRKLFKMA